MEKYQKYKDNGIEWIGKIPEKWELIKLSRLFSNIGSGTTPITTNSDYYEHGNINWLNTSDLNDSFIDSTSKHITQMAVNDYSMLKKYPVDSIVIALYGATIGKIGQLKIETTTNQACCVVSNSDRMIQRFLFYFFLAARKHILSESYGGGQPNISQDLIKQLYIPTPAISEQTAIVSFLDHKTAQIDALIEKKEKLIEKLKANRQAIINEAVTKGLNHNLPMKDSGIEWLGEIPKHWDIVKLKKVAEAFGRIGYRGYTTSDIVAKGEGAITISPSNILENKMDFADSTYISWEKYEESPEIQIYNDDILIVKTGSTYGKVGIVKNLNERATINPQLLVLKNIQINSDYLFQLLKTPLIKGQVETDVIGSTIPTISQTKILNFSLVLPPEPEIPEILLYIGKKTQIIDASVSKSFDSIKKLRLFRQSLISEAVTGKIDVQDWEKTEVGTN